MIWASLNDRTAGTAQDSFPSSPATMCSNSGSGFGLWTNRSTPRRSASLWISGDP